jgi:transcriptional regulator with XRE-family HTH domain
MSTHSYLRQLRARWMLSQEELASLLNITQGRISRYEQGEEYPPLSIVLALQIVFGKQPRLCFAGLYGQLEDEVITRAAALERDIRGKTDPSSVRKRHLLESMIARAGNAEQA